MIALVKTFKLIQYENIFLYMLRGVGDLI